MREILFRGKLKTNGKWVTGDLLTTKHGSFTAEIRFLPNKSIPSYFFAEVDPTTVGQYTGIEDKDGVKIFEGDLLDFNEAEWGGKFVPEEITIEKLVNGAVCGFIGDISEWRTVVGNIHEK